MLNTRTPFGAAFTVCATGALAAGLVISCTGTSSDDDSQTPTPTDPPAEQTQTQVPGTPTESPTPQPTDLPCRPITDLQDASAANHPTLANRVKLCDVIVTAKRFDGTIYVGDPAGGAYSGIYVFQPDGATFIPDDIALGDSVTIVGEFAANFGVNQIGLFSDETPESSVTVNSSDNALPAPVAIADASTIATACDAQTSGPDAAKYEGVRVSVSGVTVTDLDPCSQGQFGVFEVDDSLWIDDDLGNDFTPTGVGEELTSVVGVLHYTFDHFRLFPGEGDVETAGNITPPPCEGVDITSLQDVSAEDHPALDTQLSVCQAVVTALDPGDGFVIQDAAGGAYSGIYVFVGNYKGPTLAVGDVVNVTGKFAEYFGSLQLNLNQNAQARVSVVSNGAELPAAVSIADVSKIATPCPAEGDPVSGPDARKYEGVRVTFGPVTVTDVNPCAQGQYGVFEVDDTLYIDDDFKRDHAGDGESSGTDLAVDTELTSITGVVHFSFDHYRVFPGPGDMVVAEASGKAKAPAAPAVLPTVAP